MGSIIPDGKYKGFEKMDESTDKKVILKKDNTIVTINVNDDGTAGEIKTQTDIGSKKDWKDFCDI